MVAGLMLACVVTVSAGQSPDDERGRQLAADAYRQLTGYGDATARLTIIVGNGRDEERRRSVRWRSIEPRGGGERTLVVFEEPRDVRGTALLTVTRPGAEDEQWLYLPAMNRVKRIASHSRSGSFMGTEFSYEDIALPDVGRYRHRWIGEDSLEGVAAWRVERLALDPASQYGRQVVWIDRDHHRLLRIDFFDRNDQPLKTLRFVGYRLYGERYWRPDELRMVNHRTGATTVIEWRDYRFRMGLAERDFDPAVLARSQ